MLSYYDNTEKIGIDHAREARVIPRRRCDGPVEIPGQVVPAGTYVFKLLDSQSDRNVVQVFDEREKHLFGTFLTIPDSRMKPAGKPIITFTERAADAPEAVRAWFDQGGNYGHDFVYPKAKASESQENRKLSTCHRVVQTGWRKGALVWRALPLSWMLWIALGLAQQAPAPPDTGKFSIAANLVELRVTARDRSGKFVTGLDLEIRRDRPTGVQKSRIDVSAHLTRHLVCDSGQSAKLAKN